MKNSVIVFHQCKNRCSPSGQTEKRGVPLFSRAGTHVFLKVSVLLLGLLLPATINAAVFDFSSGGTTPTVNGITLTATTDSGGGLSTWSGVLFDYNNTGRYLQFDFSSEVDVSNFKVGFWSNSGFAGPFQIQGFNGATTYTYSATPGSLYDSSGNTPPYTVNLSGANDWGAVTRIRVTNLGSGTVAFNADDIYFTANTAPSFNDGASTTLIVQEDSSANSLNALLDITDPDAGNPLTWSVTTAPDNGALGGFNATATSNGGAVMPSGLTYTPAANYSGADSFSIQVSDGKLTDAITVYVTITEVNDAPSFTKGGDQTVNEDAGSQTISGWASSISPGGGSDESGQTLTFHLTNTNNALFSAQPLVDASGNLTYAPAAHANGSATVTITLSDNGGTANGGMDTSGSQTFTITATAVNDPPVNTVVPTVSGTLLIGETLTATAGVWNDDLDTNVSGTSTITYAYQWQRADDASGTNLSNISGATNAAYTVTPANVHTYLRVTVTAADTGVGSPVTQSASASSVYGLVGNSAPVITPGAPVAVTMDEDGAWTPPTISATDADADALTWSAVSGPSHGTATVSGTGTSPTMTYTPTTNWNGTDSVVVQVSDGHGGAASLTVNITVNAINDAPVNTAVPTISGSLLIGDVLTAAPGVWNDDLDTSVSGTSTLTYAYQWQRADDASGTNLSTISGVTNTTYTVTAADVHTYLRVTVTATDTGVGSPVTQSASASSVYGQVTNSAPVMMPGAPVAVTMYEDGAWSPPVISATDADGDPLTWSAASGPVHGTATVSGAGAAPTISYTPTANWNGPDSLVVQVDDGQGGSASIAVNITVNAINDAPVNTAAPTISGSLLLGNTLTAIPGVWDDDVDTSVSGASTLTYAYQWQRADDISGANLSNISGATTATYTVTAADVGRALRLMIGATDTGVGAPASQTATAFSAYGAITDGVAVSKTSVTVSESGTSETFTVVLTTQPGSQVVFTINSSNTGEATVSPAMLTFTASNWSTAQTVTVTGVNDTLQDGAQASTVTVSVDDANSDDAFDALADNTVSVTTADNDTFLAGQWQDANKNGPDDSDLCWAAAAANLLAWGGWDAGFSGSQAIFDEFEAHWTNASSRMYEAWNWWLDGTAPGRRAPGAKVDVGGAGGYYQGDYSRAFFVSTMIGSADLLIDTLAAAFDNAFGVAIGLLDTVSTDTHALTVWGYDTDSAGDLLGLYVTDSDDGVNQLVYYAMAYDNLTNSWTLSGTNWYLRELNALGTHGGATNVDAFGSSGTITGQRYGDGGIKILTPTQPIPEPSGLILVGLGLLGLLGGIYRRRRR